MKSLTLRSKEARFKICSLLPRSDERSFRTFLGFERQRWVLSF